MESSWEEKEHCSGGKYISPGECRDLVDVLALTRVARSSSHALFIKRSASFSLELSSSQS
jgi:hypothetical protein